MGRMVNDHVLTDVNEDCLEHGKWLVDSVLFDFDVMWCEENGGRERVRRNGMNGLDALPEMRHMARAAARANRCGLRARIDELNGPMASHLHVLAG